MKMTIQTVRDGPSGGYRVTFVDGTIMDVMNNPQNRFFQQVQDWIALGNTPDPFIPPVRPPKSAANLSAEEVATELVRKGLISRAEFDAIKTRR